MCYNPFRSEQGGGSSENIAKPTKQQLDWHGLKPGFYYSTVCNGYYGINDSLPQDTRGKAYRAYVKKVEAQVKELWSSYGPLVEIWFDGGVIPPEEGGLDLMPLLQKYQPDAICFQGPKAWPHNVRWLKGFPSAGFPIRRTRSPTARASESPSVTDFP